MRYNSIMPIYNENMSMSLLFLPVFIDLATRLLVA